MRRPSIVLIPILALAVAPTFIQAQERPRVRVAPRVLVERQVRRPLIEQRARIVEQRRAAIMQRVRDRARIEPRIRERIEARVQVPRIRERIEARIQVPRIRERIEARVQVPRAAVAPRLERDLLRQRLDVMRAPMLRVRPLLRDVRALRLRRWL